jgi:hypothetical protein
MALENILDGDGVKNAPLIGLKGVDPLTNLDQGDTKNIPLIGLRGDQGLMQTQEGQVPSSYSRILKDSYHPEFSPSTIQRQLATNQTAGGQLVNTLAGAAMGEIGGGFLKDIGYLMGGPAMLSRDAEDSLGKDFINAGSALQEKSNELFPVYRDPSAPKFDPSSWSWWLDNAKGMASIIPAAALAYTGVGAVGSIAEVLGIPSALGLSAIEQAGVSAVGKGIMQRQVYNMMFAHSTYEDIYQKALQSGMKEPDANKKASIAASDSYKKDWALLPLDIVQYGLVTKALLNPEQPYSFSFGKFMKKPIEELATAPLKRLGSEIAIGGGQLGFQWMMSEEGKYTAEKAFDPSIKSDFSERVGKYLQNGEFWSSAVMGGMGGAVFTGIGSLLDRAFHGDPQMNEAKYWATTFKEAHEKSRVAEETGDTQLAKDAQHDHEIQLGTRMAQNGLLEPGIDFFKKVAKGEFTSDEGKKIGLTDEDIQKLKNVNPADIDESVKNIREAGEKYQTRLKETLTDGTELNKAVNKLYEDRPKDYQRATLPDYARMYASLVSQTETKINRLNESRIQLETDLKNTEGKIVNWSSLSANKQNQWLEESHRSAIAAQQLIIENAYDAVKDREDIDDNYKNDLKFQLNTANQLLKKHETALKQYQKDYTEEDKENDKGIDITSDAMHEYLDQDYSHAATLLKIASLQAASDRYRKGQISTPEQRLEYNTNVDEQTPKDLIPEENDLVGWTDEQGQRHAGTVTAIDNKDPDSYTVQELGRDYKDIGESIVKNKVDLEVLNKLSDNAANNWDVDTSDENPNVVEQNEMLRDGTNHALADPSSLSTSNINKAFSGGIEYRDQKLYNWSNQPNNTFTPSDRATYTIDWDNSFWDTRQGIKTALQNKKGINELLEEDLKRSFRYTSLIDKIPIKVSLGVGKDTFDTRLYLHDSDFWNVRKPGNVLADPEVFVKEWRESLRSTRRQILIQLLNDQTVETTGLKKASSGPFNVIKTNGNIHQRFNIKPNEFKTYIGVDGLLGSTNAVAGPNDLTSIDGLSRGSVYLKMNKTANGEYRFVKLNPGKLSDEHADILFDAIVQRQRNGSKFVLKDSRIKGDLTTNEIIQLLAYTGDRNTNPDHPNNAGKDIPANKALYIRHKNGTAVLYFGDDSLDLYNYSTGDKQKFKDWATANKNYRIPISIDKMGLSLNDVYKKEFSIGSLKNDPKNNKTWVATLMDTNVAPEGEEPRYVLSTNIDRVKDTTTGEYIESITHSPLIDINTRSLEVKEPKYTAKIEEEVKPKRYQKPPAEYPKPESITDEKDIVSKSHIGTLKQLNVGTELSYTDVEGTHPFGVIEVAGNGVKSIKLTNGYDNIDELHNKKNLRIVVANQNDINDLFKYVLTGAKSIDFNEVKLPEVKEEQPIKKFTLGDMKPLGSTELGKQLYIPKEPIEPISSKELDWLRDKLGKQNVQITNRLIDIAGRTGQKYFGSFQSDLIKVFEAAPGTVLYHEAFHRVSKGYLSDFERRAVYDEARQRYGLKGASNEAVEEFLADKFMEYKSTGAKPETRGVIQYIKDLYDFIKSIFTGESRLRSYDIDKLFDSIERGKFRYSKISVDNLRQLNGKAFGYEIGNKDIPTIESFDDLKDLTKGLASILITENHVQDVNDALTIGAGFFKPLIDYIRHDPDPNKPDDNGGLIQQFKSVIAYDQHELIRADLDPKESEKLQAELQQVTKLKDLYESILDPQYFPIFVDKINTALASYNIAKRVVDKEYTDDEYINENNDRDLFMDYITKAPYEVNIKDTVNAAIKFLVATLPDSPEVNPRTFTIRHVDFNDTWSKLLNDCHNADTPEEGLDILDGKSDIYSYKVLAQRLRAGDDLLRNQFKVAMNKQRNLFINWLFTLDRDGKPTFDASDASYRSAIATEIASWNDILFSSNLIDRVGKPKLDMSKINPILKDYNTFKNNFSKDYETNDRTLTDEQVDKHINNFLPLVNKIGIDVDRSTVDEAINKFSRESKLTKSEALNKFFLDDFQRILKKIEDQGNGVGKTVSLRTLLSDEKLIRDLAQTKYEVKPELLSDTVLGPGNNQYFTYSQNTYLSDVFRGFMKDPRIVLNKLTKVYNKHSDFLGQLTDDNVRQGVGILTNSALIQQGIGDSGRDYLSLNRMEDYLMKMYAFERNIIPLPTLGDKTSYYFIKGLKPIDFDLSWGDDGKPIIPKNVIDLFYNYALDEKERREKADVVIKDYEAEKDEAIKRDKLKKLYANYHYVQRGDNPPATKQANALRWLLFPEFGEKKDFNFEQDARPIIEKVLSDRLNDELKIANQKGLISGRLMEDGRFRPDANAKLDAGILARNIEQHGTEQHAIENMMARFVIRNIQSAIEYSKLITGDPAFKKWNPEKGSIDDDYTKRMGAAISTGDVTNNSSKDYGVDATNYSVATMYTQRVKLDRLLKENYENIFSAQLRELAKEYSLTDLTRSKQLDALKSKGINLVDMLKGYNDIDSTDGQVYIRPDMYRSFSISVGEWSPKKEEAFKLLQSDRPLTQGEYENSMNVVMQPLKVLSYGLMADGELEVPIMNKMSLATIFRQMGQFGHTKGTRIELMNLLDRMESKGDYKDFKPIDMIKMDTAVKSGGKIGFNFYKDADLSQTGDFSDIPVFEEPYALNRKQLNTDPHDQEDIKVTSQMIKISMSNLRLGDAIYDNPRSGEKLKGSDIANNIFKSTSAISDHGRERIEKKLDIQNGVLNKEKLTAMIRDNALKAGSPDLIVDALRMDDNGKDPYLEIDALPNRKQIQAGLISSFGKQTVDLKFPGMQAVQMSNMGIRVNKDDELKYTTASEISVNSMECYVSLNLFKHIIPNYDNLSYAEKRKFVLVNKDTIMGYRVPAQGQSSVWQLKVKDVYPETIGDVVTLPAAFTTLTGSDFDIDKAYLIRHNYTIIDGKPHKIGFYDTPQEVWDNEYQPKYEVLQRALTRLDQIHDNDFAPTGGKISTENLLNSIDKILTPDIVDESKKENTLKSLLYNIFNDKFVDEEYDKLKSLIGKMEDRKKEFFDKYGDETDPYKFNSEEAVQNLLMDSYKSIFTNLAHVVDTTTPLGAYDSMINNLADEIHKYDPTKYSSKDLTLYLPSRQSDIKFEQTGGKGGMAPAALNNVHHVLSQIAGLKMKDYRPVEGVLNTDENGRLDLSQINGKDNLPISSWLSSLINIHIDASKDPRFMYLNINPTTWDVAYFLVRSGFGLDTFRLTSQPIIKEYSDLMLDSQNGNRISRFTDRRTVLQHLRAEWANKLEKGVTRESTDNAKLLSTEEMTKNIASQGKDISKQLQYLDLFDEFQKQGKILNGLVQASQLDIKRKVGNSIISLLDTRDKIDQLFKDDNFIGLDKMFEEGSFLGAYYKNFLDFTLKSLSDVSIYSTPVFTKLFREVQRLTHTNFGGDKRLADNIADELMNTVYAGFWNDKDYVGLDFKRVSVIFKRVVESLQSIKTSPEYKELSKNPLIKILNKTPLENIPDELPFDSFLTVPSKNLKDKFSSDGLMYGWRDLFQSKDEKVRNLARYLLYYSYITSGFRNRIFSFHNYIPPSIMKEFDGVDPVSGESKPFSFNEYIKKTRDLMSDPDNVPMFSYLVDETIINNWSNSKIQPTAIARNIISPINMIGDKITDKPTAFVTNLWGTWLGKNASGQPIWTKYITELVPGEGKQEAQYIGYVKTVGRTGNDINLPVYKIIPKKSYERGGVVIKEALFDKSILPSNNVDYIKDGDEFNTLTSKKVIEDQPIYKEFTPVTDYQTVNPRDIQSDDVPDVSVEPKVDVIKEQLDQQISENKEPEEPLAVKKEAGDKRSYSPREVLDRFKTAKTIKDAEDIILGYKYVINPKRYNDKLYIAKETVKSNISNYELTKDMVDKVNIEIPNLLSINPSLAENGRPIYDIRINEHVWNEYVNRDPQLALPMKSIDEQVAEAKLTDRDDILNVFAQTKGIKNAYQWLDRTVELIPDLSTEHRDFINTIKAYGESNPDIGILQINKWEIDKYFAPPKDDPTYYHDALGSYKNGTIYLIKGPLAKETKSTLVGTFLHEMTHARTLDVYRRWEKGETLTDVESKFMTDVDKIYKDARKVTKFEDDPSYKDLKEFLADGITDQQIIDELKTKMGLWERIKSAICKLFGWEYTPKSYHYKLLSSIMDYAYKDKRPNTGVEGMEAAKIANNVKVNKDNPKHVEIKDALLKSEDAYDKMTPFEPTYIMMDRLYMGGKPYDLFDEKSRGNIDRYYGTDLATRMQLEKSFQDVQDKIQTKYKLSGEAANDLSKIFKQIQDKVGPGASIFSNVTLADFTEKLASKADLIVISKDNKVHIFKFKSREIGFESYDRDFATKPSRFKFSEYKRDQVDLTILSNMFKAITNIDVERDGLHIIPLKPIVNDQTKTIDRYVIDKSFDNRDVIDMPTTNNAALLYLNKTKSMNPMDNQDVLSQDEMDAVKSANEKWQNKIEKVEVQTPEQEVLKRVVNSLEKQMAITFKRGTAKTFREQMDYINKIKKEDDTQKALSYVIDVANHITKRAYNDLNKLKLEGQPTLQQLYRFKDAVSAFDILDQYDAFLTEKYGLTAPKSMQQSDPDSFGKLMALREKLSDAIKHKNSVKLDYERIGLDVLADKILPYFTKIVSEFKNKYISEYKVARYDKEHGIVKQRTGQTDAQYRDYVNMVENFNPNLTEQEYVNSKMDENGDTIQEKSKLIIRKELKKASQDISTLARWIDNILDSPDPVVGALVKSFVAKDDEARIEIEDHRLRALPITEEFMEATKQYGNNYQKRYDYLAERDLKTGKLSGHVISKFHSSLIAEMRNIRAIADATIEDESQRDAFVNAWKETNMPLNRLVRDAAYQKYLDQLVADKEISSAEYNILKISKDRISDLKNQEGSPITDNTEDLILQWYQDNSLNYREPAAKWINPQWAKLQKILSNPNDPRTKMYNLILEWQDLADSMVPSSVKLGTRLPGVIKDKIERLGSGQNLAEMSKGAFSKALNFKVDDTHRVQTDLVDNENNARYFVPTHYTGFVSKLVKDEIGNEYKEFDPDEQSWNLANIYFHYLGSAIEFEWKNDILPEMEMARFLFNNRDVVKRDSKGNILYQANRWFGPTEEEGIPQVTKGGNIAKQFDDWLLYALYGQGTKDLGTIPGTNIDAGKFVNVLQRFTGLNLLGLNYVAGTASTVLTETIMGIDALANAEIGKHEWKVAQGTFFKNLGGILADIGSKQPSNLVSLLLKEFNVIHAGKFANLTDSKFRILANTDALYFVGTFGWYTMQVKSMLGMLEKRKAFDSEGKDIGSILSHYKVVDGKLALDKEVDESRSHWTNIDRRVYEHNIRGVISSIHGDQSDLGRVAAQGNALLGMAMQFRRFIVPTFKRRWGGARYDERTADNQMGMYTNTAKFARQLLKNMSEAKSFMLSREWAIADHLTKVNVIRTFGDVITVLSAVILANAAISMAKNAQQEKDRDAEMKMWNFMAYQALRLKAEFLFYTSPTQAMQILRSPAASMSMFENTIKLATQILGPGWQEYQQGPFKNQLKIKKTLIDMTVGVKQYYRLREMGQQVSLMKSNVVKVQ